MTSVCSISRLLMRAWAPVSCIVGRFLLRDCGKESGQKKPPAWARGENARARRRRASGNYEEGGAVLHEPTIMPEATAERKSFRLSALVDRARVGRPTTHRAAEQRRAVLGAVQAGSPRRREVAGLGTTARAEDPQRVADRPVEALHLVVSQFVGGA